MAVRLGNWWSLIKRRRRRSRCALQREIPGPARFRPGLELLESRTVPAGPHIHAHLTILVNSQSQPIPANLGIGPHGEMESIHTHDTTGLLHVHPLAARDVPLQELFTAWGQPFSRQYILGYVADSAHPVTMTVNGQPNEALGAYVFRDGDNMVIQADQAVMARDLSAAAQAITHSAEHYRSIVTHTYQHYLERNPDLAGLTYWVSQLQQGLTEERLEASFVSSAEYRASQGSTDAAWIRGMYQDLLDRAADDAGLNAWLGRLTAGAQPYEIALGLTTSLEHAAQRIRADYFTYLGRAAAAEEVSFWAGRLQEGVDHATLVAGFLSSTEYYYKPAKGQGNPADWIQSLYRDVLHRSAGEAEVKAWLRSLGRG